VFGSEAWAHIHNDKRKALQLLCIFVGYSEDAKQDGIDEECDIGEKPLIVPII